MVYRNGNWVESDKDVTLDNGIVVSRKGEVRRDKGVVVINDSEVLDRSGNFWTKQEMQLRTAGMLPKEE